jgi:hypothetical protein
MTPRRVRRKRKASCLTVIGNIIPAELAVCEVDDDDNDFICLFVLFSFIRPFTPEEEYRQGQRKPAAALRASPRHRKSSAPSLRCAPFSGCGSPYKYCRRGDQRGKQKSKKFHSARSVSSPAFHTIQSSILVAWASLMMMMSRLYRPSSL